MSMWGATVVMFTCVVCGVSSLALAGWTLAPTRLRRLRRHLPHKAGEMLVVAIALLTSAAHAQPASPELTDNVGFDQMLGAKVPLAARFRDESGREVVLGEMFGKRPVILAPVYYGCPLLCGQVLTGLARGLKPLGLQAGKDFDVVAFSINPSETPALAASKRAVYIERYDRPGSESGWHFLTGEENSIAFLSRAIGFRYKRDARTGLYTHAAGVVVVTGDGVVSRYFFGIDFPPKELERELAQASAGRVGSPIGRLLLLCYDYDQATGKYTLSILRLMRVLGTATAVSLGGFLFILVRRELRGRRSAVRAGVHDLDTNVPGTADLP
jgi:protein SCO1